MTAASVPDDQQQRTRLCCLLAQLPQSRIIEPHQSDLPRPETIGRLCVDVMIRRVSDGVERMHSDSSGFPIRTVSSFLLDADTLDGAYEQVLRTAVDGARYWWNEGNGGCDCNRSRFHYRAGIALGVQGEEPPVTGSICRGRSGYELLSPAWLIDDPP